MQRGFFFFLLKRKKRKEKSFAQQMIPYAVVNKRRDGLIRAVHEHLFFFIYGARKLRTWLSE